MTSRAFLLALCALALPLVPAASAEAPAAPGGMKILFEDNFESGIDHWEMTDAKAWSVAEVEGGHALALTGSSAYEPEVRSPKNIAWVKDVKAGTFTLDVDMKQTGREYGHRDLCIFFGKQDATHFYYVHMATKADDHANSIFLVNGAPRVSIAKERTDGTDWGTGWHHVRVKRDIESGRIEVYFDNMEKPIMIAEDKTFVEGSFGLGSFDDVGQYDEFKVWGK